LRAKAVEPLWPPAGLYGSGDLLWVPRIQWGIGCFEHYVAGSGEAWLHAALDVGRHLVDHQQRGGRRDGGWIYVVPLPHTYRLHPPWLSALAQGEAASLLVRLYVETGTEEFGDAALRALKPLRIPSTEGGVRAQLGGRPFPEEYPTSPPSFVLNGAIFAMWGLHDVAIGLDDSDSARAFKDGVDTLAINLHRWDTGSWSRYDLFPHYVANIASPGYHALHVKQLRVMNRIAPRPEFEAAIARFASYAASRLDRSHALARKVLFRVVHPSRHPLTLLPWAQREGA
jgi:hypothetical protein